MRRVPGPALVLTLVLALVASGPLSAQELPGQSPFPRPRTLPMSPLAPLTDTAVAQALTAPVETRPEAVARSLVPRDRPARRMAGGVRVPVLETVRTEAIGRGVCGVPTLTGRTLPEIRSTTEGCGVREPVSITAVHGVSLSQAATMDCDTARAFARWVGDEMLPAVGRRGGGVAQIRVAAHYNCRTRNHQRGARISEHGRGRAIDISGYRLFDGTLVTVADHWNARPHRGDLRAMYAGACGPFRTTLGPESDRFHQDHFHFDTARHRNGGTYCR